MPIAYAATSFRLIIENSTIAQQFAPDFVSHVIRFDQIQIMKRYDIVGSYIFRYEETCARRSLILWFDYGCTVIIKRGPLFSMYSAFIVLLIWGVKIIKERI
jgi:hypothetical protein